MDLNAIKATLPSSALMTVEGLPFPKVASGKVREIFDLGEDRWLIIASDRLSAFDVIMRHGVPGKGILLTQLSLYWFSLLQSIVPNHLVPRHDEALKTYLADWPELIPRSMVVRRCKPLSIEAIVRNYLAGSSWKHYLKNGDLFGQTLSEAMVESQILPEPCFTPSTKASSGHDSPLTLEECEQALGKDLFDAVRSTSLNLFQQGSQRAEQAGFLLADTKFEFGLNHEGNLILIDEALTPDSSRYWNKKDYQPGRAQEAFDKQFVRDYLDTLDWDKTPPAPELPADIIRGTLKRYLSVLERFASTA